MLEPCSFTKASDGYLVLWYPQGPKRRNPDVHVWVKPRPDTHTKCGPRFPPQHHISYKWGYHSAPYKCLLKVLCPVRRPIKTLDCVLLKDDNRALLASLGTEINFRACLCVPQGPHHSTKCWLSIQRFIFLLMFCLETPKEGSGEVGGLYLSLSGIESLWPIWNVVPRFRMIRTVPSAPPSTPLTPTWCAA
jgi:hypothetical protein